MSSGSPVFSAEEEKTLKAWTTRFPHPNMGLIEALRQVQEWRRHIGTAEESRLAEMFGLPLGRVHEVATFFPFFTQKPTGRRRIGVCRGLSCELAGTNKAVRALGEKLGVGPGETTPDGEWSFEEMECLGACEMAPAAIVNEELVGAATEETARRIVAEPGKDFRPQTVIGPESTEHRLLTGRFGEPGLETLDGYRRAGGYEILKKAVEMGPAKIMEEVKKSNLRGLGGAGFPTGMKWGTVPPKEKMPGPRYVVVNSDESEPGCFKDRVLIENCPHGLIEGLLIASLAIGAEESFIFIRGEYKRQHHILEKALAEAEKAGLMGKNILGKDFSCAIKLTRGAGAYISGLDTALLETMEGKKAWPRQPPPFPTTHGLMNRPTVVNNVETLMMLPPLLRIGGEAFAKMGTAKCGGTAVFSISGHVERPGVYEFPMGTPLRRMIEAAGGIKGGRKLKAVIPGGASTPVLTAAEIDVAMDFDSLRGVGSFLGAGGIMVLDETVNMAFVARNIERFLAHESCGQCTPCREGSEWTVRILDRLIEGEGCPEDVVNLDRTGENIAGKVICALGDTVGSVTRAMMKKFPEDFKSEAGERSSGAGKQPAGTAA
jgi:NADH-quinone oxidoreductase subunit F